LEVYIYEMMMYAVALPSYDRPNCGLINVLHYHTLLTGLHSC